MLKFRILIGTVIYLACAASVTAQELTEVRFVHEWRIEGHLAPYFVALDKGYYRQEGLAVTIDPGTGSIDGINRIASGSYDIGQADINALIKYRDDPDALPIQAVMMAYNTPAFAILTLRESGIRNPKDLEGKILGAPAADGAYAHWPIISKLNDIDDEKVSIENVDFAVRETLLAHGRVDAVTAFSSNALALQAAGIPEEDIVTLLMRDFGLDLYGSAIIVSPSFASENPEAVRGFVKATIKGYLDTFEDPEAAIESILKANPLAKRDIELARLKLIIEQCYLTDDVRRNGFGDVELPRLEASIDQLAITFKFKNRPSAVDIFSSAYLPPQVERMPK